MGLVSVDLEDIVHVMLSRTLFTHSLMGLQRLAPPHLTPGPGLLERLQGSIHLSFVLL